MPTNINGNTGIDKVQDGTVVSADIDTLDASKLTGSIAAARIASNTIDSAHIASGAVDDAHLATGITASKLTGTIADARFPSTLPAASAANLTAIPAANITGTLPAISAANLTAIPAANITGTLPAISGANLTGLPAGGITEADQWRLTSNVTLGNDLVSWLTANWERVDTDGFGKLGTGLTESSGVFSFPSTGVWMLIFNVNGHIFNTHTRYYNATVYTTTDNSTYDSAALAQTNGYHSGNVGTYLSASCTFIFDVTNVSTHKFKMQVLSIAGGFVQSSTGSNRTSITAIKLGDT